MIRVTMLYPATDDSRFDFDYYINTHLPLAERLLKDHGFIGHEVQRCLSDARGNPPAYLCITHLDFSSLEEFQQGMALHAAELRDDFTSYTDIMPVAAVCELATNRA